MSLKTIGQEALVRIGLPKTDLVASSNDFGVQMMHSLVNQEGRDLARRHNWQALLRERQFTATPEELQAGALPSDFERFVNETFYNRSRNSLLEGPLTPQEWQGFKANNYLWPYEAFRLRGGDILILPAPREGSQMVFEYVSRNWVGGEKAEMRIDSDEALLDEEILTLGAAWRYLHAKGMDYSEAFQSYEVRLADAIARDTARRSLDFLHPNGFGQFRPYRNVRIT